MMEREPRLAFILEKTGVKEDEICSELGISKANLTKFKAGSSVPNAVLAVKIARYLGYKVEDIWG